jgi:hypothetical protein
MATNIQLGFQRIDVESDLTLQELLTVGKTYSQLYSVLYPLQTELTSSLRGEGMERLEYLYRAFPWRGGFSAVNFYQSQFYLIPVEARPIIRRIRIESPGLIELGIAVAAAYSVEHVVKSVTTSATRIGNLYHDIYRQMHERKLMRINARREELALAKEQLEFAEDAQKELGAALDLPEAEFIRMLSANPIAALKITLSLYRRAKILSKAEERGKLAIEPPVAESSKG